jgi:acyl-CoA synthetase (AMP-forming)/AMP-acid ligase II
MRRLFDSIEQFGTRPAVLEEDGRSLDFATLASLADEESQDLSGTRCLVIIEASNELRPLLAFVGACRANCPAILVEEDSLARDSRIRDVFSPAFEYLKTNDGWQFKENPHTRRPALHPDLAVLLSTSGSTGDPKLVRLSRQNIESNARSIAQYLEIDAADRAITTLPFHYSYGMSVVTSHLLTGASISLTTASVIEDQFWEQFNAQAATSFAGVPRTFEILERSGFLDQRHAGLKHFTQAGGRLSPDRVRTFAEYAQRTQTRFYVMYGQTEAAPRMSYLPPELTIQHPDCIGVPIPGGSFRLLDEKDREITQFNRAGELCYRGPNVMMGYAQTSDDLEDLPSLEELRTGDIAVKTESGLYKIVGRANRFVKIAGLRLDLDDLEEVLSHEGVESAVAGDDRLIAVATTSAEDLDLAWRTVVEGFKLPPTAVSVLQVTNLPLLPTGKPDHRSILRKAHDAQEQNYASADGSSDPDALRRELAAVLGRKALADDETFIDAGGDSLNYVEGSLIVEKHLGRVVDGWEKVPMLRLARTGATTTNAGVKGMAEAGSIATSRIGSSDVAIVARAVAISFALLSHCFGTLQVWSLLPGELRLITRIATPSFLVLTGLVLARFHSKHSKRRSLVKLFARFVPYALTVYLVFCLAQLCAFLGDKVDWERALGAVVCINKGKSGNILLVYSVLFLAMPLLIAIFEKFRVAGLAFVLTTAWGVWYVSRGTLDTHFALSFLFGAGIRVGPSVLQGLTFVIFGYALGASRQRRGDLIVALAIASISAVLVASAIWIDSFDGFVQGISSSALRRQNHPVYYGLGILGALCLLGVSQLLARVQARMAGQSGPSVFNALGANPVFAYGCGIMLLNLAPRGPVPLVYALPLSFCFIALLAALTSDVSQRTPRFFGVVAVGLRQLMTLWHELVRQPFRWSKRRTSTPRRVT